MGGIHLNFIVEGQTEETFVKGKLRPYLADKSYRNGSQLPIPGADQW